MWNSWNEFVDSASKSLNDASEVLSAKASEISQKVQEKVVEYELDKKTQSLTSTISKGVGDAVESVQSFVEENFEDDQKKQVILRKKAQKEEALQFQVYPWSVLEKEQDRYQEAKDRILEIGKDSENILDEAPEAFEFKLKATLPFAYGALKVDKELSELRYKFVPSQLKEKLFWKNYFYRVSLIRQNIGIEPLDKDNLDNYPNLEKENEIMEDSKPTSEANEPSLDAISTSKSPEDEDTKKKIVNTEVLHTEEKAKNEKNENENTSDDSDGLDLNDSDLEKELADIEVDEDDLNIDDLEKEMADLDL